MGRLLGDGDRLAAAGGLITPADAPRMPKLTASRDSVIVTDPSAHHYRLVGLEITPAQGIFLHALLQLGSPATTDVNELPHHLIIDRCYLHGDRQRGARRGIALNSRDTAIVHSYLSDF